MSFQGFDSNQCFSQFVKDSISNFQDRVFFTWILYRIYKSMLRQNHKMPTLCINTNIEQSVFTEEMLKRMTTKMAALVGKPENYIMIIIRGNQFMSFGGTVEPCASCFFESIGRINEQMNVQYAKAIFEFLSQVGIKSNRTYIKFNDLSADHVAWNGKLFSQ